VPLTCRGDQSSRLSFRQAPHDVAPGENADEPPLVDNGKVVLKVRHDEQASLTPAPKLTWTAWQNDRDCGVNSSNAATSTVQAPASCSRSLATSGSLQTPTYGEITRPR
jgi:hypothetical protein